MFRDSWQVWVTVLIVVLHRLAGIPGPLPVTRGDSVLLSHVALKVET